MPSESEIAAIVGKFHDQVSKVNRFAIQVSRVVSKVSSTTIDQVNSLSDEISSEFETLKNLSSDVYGLRDRNMSADVGKIFSSVEMNVASQLSSLSSIASVKVREESNQPSAVSSNSNADLVTALQSIVDNSRFPISEPSVFKGDPLEYAKWRSAFDSFVDRSGIKPAEKMHCLEKYTSGAAREAIEGFLTVYSDESYRNAKDLLKKRFGDRFVTTFAFRDKIESWQKISEKDSRGLLKFADFLEQAKSSLTSLETVDILDDPKENYKMLRVLPQFLVSKWAAKITDHREQHDEYPKFEDFVKFVSRQAKILNDPLIAKLNQLSGSHSSKSTSFSTNSEVTSGATAAPSGSGAAAAAEKPKVRSCSFCKSPDHYLDSCKDFSGKSFEDRRQFLFSNKFCLKCTRQGHMANRCRIRLKCSVCKKGHATSMHREAQVISQSTVVSSGPKEAEVPTPAPVPAAESKSEVSTKSTETAEVRSYFKSSGSRMCSMIVPVYVSSRSNPNHEVLVYAISDSQSDDCFISTRTLSDLNLKGTPTTISMSTLFEANSLISTSVIRNLSVRGFNEAASVKIPSAFSRDALPINSSHIPTRSLVEGIPYLAHLKDKFLPLQDIDVGLLIGFNIQESQDPLSIINSQGGGPFAMKTVLGWSISGRLDSSVCSVSSSVLSHRVLTSVGDADSPVEFVVPSHCKEVINPSDCVKALERDFADDSPSDSKSYSVSEKKFLDILSSEVYQDSDSHVTMPLPFKDSSVPVLNSRAVSYRRFEYIKSRLKSDPNFRKHYIDFMTELFEKGYAEEIPDSELDVDPRLVFYIAHHGVYHKRKGKIRVVFDCSCKVQGVSLNDLLLPGPDFLNSLIGILLRFRLHDIAFGCDIEKMFYQFRVRPEDRNFLRFFWFKDHDISKPVSTFRMTVHIFGAVSSPSVATFGLRYLADKHRKDFGDSVSDFVCRDFYVDDGLKSVECASTAVEIIQGAQQLCKKGGIRLTKFVSNSEEVVNSLPVSERAASVVDLSFDASERVLGMKWSVKSDLFEFEALHAEKPVTRRGILSTVSSVFDPLGFVSPFTLLGKRILQDICHDKFDWDAPLPQVFIGRFMNWKSDLSAFTDFSIQRCIKPPGFVAKTCQLHHFADASEFGYGQCSYLKLIDSGGNVSVSLSLPKHVSHQSNTYLYLVSNLSLLFCLPEMPPC